jgi:hypothetical protein
VLLVLDQWPAWAFAVKRPHLTRGFARLLREGAWHTGRYPSAATLTAPGHALLGTGRAPAASGIVANEWYRRSVDRVLRSVEDPDGGTSARALRAPGLGDALAAAHPAALAVSISLKDRAAILPLGRAGTPIWYDRTTRSWRSTAAPAWLAEVDRRAPIAPRIAQVWRASDPARLAAASGGPDDAPGEVGEHGLGTTFPHDPARTPDPAEALTATPAGNEAVLDAGLAAITAAGLGADVTPDLLVLSLSAHDLIGHGWGQESWEMWDMTLRLDAALDHFLAELDTRVGRGRWALAATSDHGACPLPERGSGGRLWLDTIRDAANRAAATALGPGEWIAFARYPALYLNAAARARSARDQARAVTKIVYALRAIPGLARVERTADVAGSCEARGGADRALCLALDPAESGEVVYLPAAGWVLERRDERVATSHGSLHDYDRDVPLVLLAPGRDPARAEPATAPAESLVPMETVAALLAGWLGVPPPAALPLPEPQPGPPPAPGAGLAPP